MGAVSVVLLKFDIGVFKLGAEQTADVLQLWFEGKQNWGQEKRLRPIRYEAA